MDIGSAPPSPFERRRARGLAAALAVAQIGVLPLLSATQAAAYTFTNNGFGNGTGTASVWCFPNAPPAAASLTVGGPLPQEISAAKGNLPAGCNPATFVKSDSGFLWRDTSSWAQAAGDTTDTPDLLALITRVSPLSSGKVDVTAMMPDPTDVTFFVTWSGSDAGVAADISWLDTSVSTASPPVLAEETRVGPWSESFSKSFTSSELTDPSVDLMAGISLQISGAGTSLPVPEPFGAALLGAAIAVLAGLLIRRRKGG